MGIDSNVVKVVQKRKLGAARLIASVSGRVPRLGTMYPVRHDHIEAVNRFGVMLFSEQDAPQLKKWIVKRLENTSDADADVLADYVLALLRHDGDMQTVRRLCEEEIPDFLKEDSSVFVNDVFDAIKYKSYLPGAPPPPPRSSISANPPAVLPGAPSAPYYGVGVDISGAPRGPQNGSRKRSYNDRGDNDVQDGGDYQFGGDTNGRSFKQPRRGGSMGRGGRFDSYGNGRGGRSSQPPNMNLPPMPPQAFPNLPPMPSPPPGMPPLDPNNPMAALLAMQAMGMPFPGMPPYQQAGSPVAQAGSPRSGFPPPVKRQRCRDYDTKGFCARGNTCIYEHGTDSIFVPPNAMDEYDPANSSLMPGIETPSLPTMPALSQTTFDNSRGNDRGRGRGRGLRGDRGGTNGAPTNRRGGRAEFSSDRPNFDRTKTTIVVENIPEEKFSEEAVREFFSEFGVIIEVTMKPYKRLALVKYDDWSAAKAAYSSPKVIFDNRFVKVYWYTNDEALPKPPNAIGTGTNGSVDQGNAAQASTLAPPSVSSEPQIDLEEFSRKQQEVQKAHEEKMKKKAEMEAAQKELERRQEELLKKQAEEKRKLMEKLAAKTNKTTSSPVTEQNGVPTASTAKASSQTEALKAQLAALEAEAKSLGLDTALTDDTSWGGRGRGRGRGSYRGRGTFVPRGTRGFDRGGYRGRGGAPFAGVGAAYKLDNRPKKVALTGVDFTNPEKEESLRQYLLGVGEYTDLEMAPEKTLITFKDRFTAEKFMYGTNNGEIPSAGKVEMAWIQTPLPPMNLSSKPTNAAKPESSDGMQIDQGDSMVQDSSPMQGSGHVQEQQELDYDVADDNDWGIQ